MSSPKKHLTEIVFSDKKTNSKTAFFVRRSRSPSRSSKSPAPEEEKISRTEKTPNEEFKGVVHVPSSTIASAPIVPRDFYENSDTDSYLKSPESVTGNNDLSSLDITDDETPETIIPTDDIDFNPSSDLCSHQNVLKKNSTVICEDCGVELYQEISHDQEWRYFGDQDSHNSKDPSRCQFRKSPEKGITKELERLGFPPDICELSNNLYMTVTKGEIKRSDLRKGIELGCILDAYKIKGKLKTPEEIQKRLGIDRKSMSQGINYYRLRCPREMFQHEDISAKHFIPGIMKDHLKIDKADHIEKVILLYEKIKNACAVINRSNPQSISKALIFYYLRRKGCNINVVRYSRIVALSDVIILRLAGEVSRVLGTADLVKLT